MVQLFEVESGVFVAPQLIVEDFAEIARSGIRAVINNRPDGEASDQLPSASAEAEAARHGIEYRYMPVIGYEVTDDKNVDGVRSLMAELPRPLVLYCRSGTRCATLWTQAKAATLGVDHALAAARKAGYDLSELRDELEDRVARETIGPLRLTALQLEVADLV